MYICVCMYIYICVCVCVCAYSGCKRNLHMVKMGEKYTCFNNWIYSILNIQSLYRHMALCFYDVLESI